MKQLVATVAVLIAVVGAIAWVTSGSSSAQDGDTPPETTEPGEGSTNEPEDLSGSFESFLECLRDQGIDVPDVEEGDGRFGFHFDFNTEDVEGLKDAHEVCGDDSLFPFKHFQFGDEFPFDGEPFGDAPFRGRFGFSFEDFGFGGALDLDQLAECLSELGTFQNVDEVKAQLEQCLPAPGGLDPDNFESFFQDGGEFPFGGLGGFGFFDGPDGFGFEFDFDGEFGEPDSDLEDSALQGATV